MCFAIIAGMKKNYNIGIANPMYGRKHTSETLQKMRQTKLGSSNPSWRGDDVGYSALHQWVVSRKPKPEFCEECGKNKPFDLASINDKYTRNINDWQWLCRNCHMKKDNRLYRLHMIAISDKNLERDKNGRFKRRN